MATRLRTVWSCWLSNSARVCTRPRSGLERERRVWTIVAHPRRREAGDLGQVMGDDQPHGDSGGVPATGDQAAEGAAGGEPGVHMDRLWVETLGEGDDLGLAHAGVPVLIHRASQVILEKARLNADREVAFAQHARRAARPTGIRHGRPEPPGLLTPTYWWAILGLNQ